MVPIKTLERQPRKRKSCTACTQKILIKEKFESVALPKLATGVGGLDWNQVYPLTKSQLGELEIPVYVNVVFHQGQKAMEKGENV